MNETSPYLLQHADNPVDWYPWGKEAFEKAAKEDKPVFLSIGYSTCHWCHVMAHESFEDSDIADILNRYFISIKVDKEERPDIDSVYMAVCQAFTGSGGWPTTIFMTPDKLPFFAGTYFPKASSHGMPGLYQLLCQIHMQWESSRKILISSGMDIVEHLNENYKYPSEVNEMLLTEAEDMFSKTFDSKYGGFGDSPKFPTAHNLLFLMERFKKSHKKELMEMTETTLRQMYMGGLFDHIGGGFSRYSTDRYFLVPHFEKMLYDNALLLMSYSAAYSITGDPLYLSVGERTAFYILREMRGTHGGFYCAQDADSEGVEGKYYVFTPCEIVKVLGAERGKVFCEAYNITHEGNFEGKSIPNLLNSGPLYNKFETELKRLYDYRKSRHSLHLDDKVLCSWNSLMISALAILYRVTQKSIYLDSAIKGQMFIESHMLKGSVLYTSFRNEQLGAEGFLDDYAFYILALLILYDATLNQKYLKDSIALCHKVLEDFYDDVNGGFWLYGKGGEKLIVRPKETYDGAMPSGNSVMAYNLVRLFSLTGDESYEGLCRSQLEFMSSSAQGYPIGYSFFLIALSIYTEPFEKIKIVLKEGDSPTDIAKLIPLYASAVVLENPGKEYNLINDKTTYYICKGHACLPPVNQI